jgi:hypothetical protein
MENSIKLLDSRVYLIEKKLEYLTTLIVTWTKLTTLDTTSKPPPETPVIEIIVNDNEEDNYNVDENDDLRHEDVGHENYVDKIPIHMVEMVVNKCPSLPTMSPSNNLFDDKRNWYLRRII